MRLPTDAMHPALRGIFGLVTAGLKVLIGVIIRSDAQGARQYLAWVFFALAAYRAFEAVKDLVRGLRPAEEEDEDD